MRPLLATLVLFATMGVMLAQPVHEKVELSGIGFALERDTTEQLSITEPQSLMVKIFVHQEGEKNNPESSSIRLRYDTYPIEVVELANNYLEANVYSMVISEGNQLKRGEPLGKLKVTLALFAGLEGAKGSLTIGAKTYQVLFYLNEALEDYASWLEE